MEIINKVHEEYKAIRRIKNGKPFIFFAKDENRIFISAAAADEWNLINGMKAHFAIDIDRAYIFFNDDPSGLSAQYLNSGIRLHSVLIYKMLLDKVREIKPQSKFPLRKSNTNIQDSLTLEIMIHKKI